jgi:hypothetical protein
MTVVCNCSAPIKKGINYGLFRHRHQAKTSTDAKQSREEACYLGRRPMDQDFDYSIDHELHTIPSISCHVPGIFNQRKNCSNLLTNSETGQSQLSIDQIGGCL